MLRERRFFVYIMTNRSKTLYTGITSDSVRRVWEHKCGKGSEFTAKYRLDRLVYIEAFRYVDKAIAREKEIKGWKRVRKIALIVAKNPTWTDLSEDWYQPTGMDQISRVDNGWKYIGPSSPSFRKRNSNFLRMTIKERDRET